MYKVLIVDDEKPGRDIINYIIDWHKTNFKIIDTAKNGQDALSKYKSILPDLIITDIQMPVMDGLEMIKEIKKINPNQKFIILSCHEDFYYAKEAIKMKVTDYLIKDLITAEELYALLSKIEGELNSSQSILYTEFSKGEKFFEEFKHSVLKDLLFNSYNIERIIYLIKEYNLDIVAENSMYSVMCISIDEYYLNLATKSYIDEKNINKEILTTINSIIKTHCNGECVYTKNGNFSAILSLKRDNSELNYIEKIHKIAEAIKREILSSLNISLTISISRQFIDLRKLPIKHTETFDMLKYKIFLGNGKTILHNTFYSDQCQLNTDILKRRLDNIQDAFNNNNEEKLLKEINNIYSKDLKGFMQYNYIKFTNSHLFEIIAIILNEYSIPYINVFDVDYLPIAKVSEFETINKMSNWFSNIFVKILRIKDEKTCNKYSKLVNDCIDFIKHNYSNYDLSLSYIADNLNVHKVYLCRIFKKETEINLSNYIMDLRIKKAKEMLSSSQLKSYEIAEKVGFKNPQQFSMAFKKYVGVSPNKYKNSS
ncbi:response regulator [Clostridium sediminicola]|uniref:response regulator transcription factor n=1 Tax=Clostridium sediminicola TaxID=3114879 RepID=UPI0031F1FD28